MRPIEMAKQRRAWPFVAIVLAGGIAAGCGTPTGSVGAPATATAGAPAQTTSAPSAAAPESGVVLQLTAQQPAGKDVGWSVYELEGPAGQTFDVDYDNTDDARHDFAIFDVDAPVTSDEFFKSEMVKPGESAVITVPGLPAGVYDFVCTLHSTEMRGTLTLR